MCITLDTLITIAMFVTITSFVSSMIYSVVSSPDGGNIKSEPIEPIEYCQYTIRLLGIDPDDYIKAIKHVKRYFGKNYVRLCLQRETNSNDTMTFIVNGTVGNGYAGNVLSDLNTTLSGAISYHKRHNLRIAMCD